MTAAPDQRLGWMHEGSRIFLGELEKVPDGDWAEPVGLPGWGFAHLIAHVAYNAAALSRLVHWARTGEETPMYSGPEQRAAEIEHGATLPPARLRALVRETDEQLRADLGGLSAWDAQVRTAQGRTVPATEIPWLRTREVWIHTVDLGTGFRFEDFPADLLGALITDITGLRQYRDGGPALALHPDDREDRWRIVDVLGGEPAVVRGSAAELARWLAGRGRTGDKPVLGRWL
ncbi:maleylpyruvate isomerase family mycothiol-dependent enzyme [Streptomyces sp. NPDC096132]|uniref:maleylpyruvate isomerase family mycothiol-dependent enzyme n=1 Tax=Streptomyces sp. NPDC096132 TaxID=3366075 RepID=UPI00382C4012